jgi:hypothetical protein
MTTSVGSRLAMKWDPDWDDEVRRSLDAKRAMEGVANSGAAAARRVAPVGQGDYQRSIKPVVASVGGAWVAAVVAEDWKAVWIERGAVSPTYTTPAMHVLQRGVESTGVKVVARP